MIAQSRLRRCKQGNFLNEITKLVGNWQKWKNSAKLSVVIMGLKARHMKLIKSIILRHNTLAGIFTAVSLLALSSQSSIGAPSEVKAETKTSSSSSKTSAKADTKTDSKTTTKSETKTDIKAAEAKSTSKTAGTKTDTKSAAKSTDKVSSDTPQVIDFGASWCVPCKKFAPTFDKVGETYKGKVKFVHYDVESATGKPLATKYNIGVMPTIMMLDAKGKVAWKNEGVPSEADLVKHTEALLK